MTLSVSVPANMVLPTLHQTRAYIHRSDLERGLGHPPRPRKIRAKWRNRPYMTPAAKLHNRQQKLHKRFVRQGWSA